MSEISRRDQISAIRRNIVAAVALPLVLMGCGGGPGDRDSATAPDSTSAGRDGAGLDTYRRGADVAIFCDVVAEIDASIYAIDGGVDAPEQSDEEDWRRVLKAFAALDATGVPDDLPYRGLVELDTLEDTVRRNNSASDFQEDLAERPVAFLTVRRYKREQCGIPG